MTALDPVTLADPQGPARADRRRDGRDALPLGLQPDHRRSARRLPRHLPCGERARRSSRARKGLPIFVGAMAFAVKAVIDKVGRDGGLAAGDTFLFNDPYAGGHASQRFPARAADLPRRRRCSAGSPRSDTGSTSAATCPATITRRRPRASRKECCIPPVKLVAGGRMNQDIVDILAANSRVPTSNWGDLNGQLNALDLGERRLRALLDEYGDDTVTRRLRGAVRPRRGADARQHRGAAGRDLFASRTISTTTASPTSRSCIALDLTIAGDAASSIFRAPPRPAQGPINIASPTAVAACYVALKHVFTEVPANAGCLRADRLRHSRHDAARREGAPARSAATRRRSCA